MLPLNLAGLVGRGAGSLGGVGEGAIATVEEEEVGAAVVGDVKVGPVVAIEVGGNDAEPPTVAPEDAGRRGRVFKGAVAPVPEEVMANRSDRVRSAVDPDLFFEVAAEGFLAERPLAVTGDVKVEVSVAVVVKKGRAGRPGGGVQARAGEVASRKEPSPLLR